MLWYAQHKIFLLPLLLLLLPPLLPPDDLGLGAAAGALLWL
jgi:hypothetical protein